MSDYDATQVRQHDKLRDKPGTTAEATAIAAAKATIAANVAAAMSGGKRPIDTIGTSTPTPAV